MARSSYIYVVQAPSGTVLAAFTVKHELSSWMDRDGGRHRNPTRREDLVSVTRLRDGLGAGPGPVVLNPRTLEPAI